MKDIKPNYYRRTIKGIEIDVNDIADAFDLGYQAQNAIKYLVRAGRKDETTLVDDLIKARHYIDRLIKKHEDETTRRESFDRAWDKLADRNAEKQDDPACCGQIQSLNDAAVDLSYGATVTKEEATKAVETIQHFKRRRSETNPETIIRDDNDGVVAINKPATPVTATAWPCWVFTRLAPRDYTIAGPYPTREAARRALDPERTDERVVMADDPYQVEADVIERLFA